MAEGSKPCHWEVEYALSSPVPAPRPWSFRFDLLAVVGNATGFRLSGGLVALGYASVLIYSAVAHLLASSTFFSIFITPLIYRLKSPKSKFRQIIFWFFYDRVFWKLEFPVSCPDSFPRSSDPHPPSLEFFHFSHVFWLQQNSSHAILESGT